MFAPKRAGPSTHEVNQMRLFLNHGHWLCFTIAAAIAVDSGIAATYGHYAARLIARATEVLP